MSIIQNIKNRIKPPGPKALGWARTDVLGMRGLMPDHVGLTWEDWHVHVKKYYPVRYFVCEELPRWLSPIRRFFTNSWYWLQCHTLKSYRFHVLDLRGVDPTSSYTHGYLDPSDIMELAAWASLRIYVEKHKPEDPADWASKEELENEPLKGQKASYDEIMALYDWWMNGRWKEKEESDRLYREAYEVSSSHLPLAKNDVRQAWFNHDQQMAARSEEMFMRLCRVRHSLWT